MRFTILGVLISKMNLKETIHFLINYDFRYTHYICLPDLSVLIVAQKNQKLKEILNNSLLTLPDGKSIEFIGRLKGIKGISTVSGYWLIKELLSTPLKHFFYGSNPVSLATMIIRMKEKYPNSIIAGYASPHFRTRQD